MADLGMDFDHTEVEISDFSPMPPGDYELQVVEADVKANSKGTGMILSLKVEVINPPEHQGRFVFANINFRHENPTAQKIGQEELSKLCKAVGLEGKLKDSDQLLYQPFYGALIVEEYTGRNGQPRQRNAIKDYHYQTDQSPPESKPAPTPSTSPNRPATGGAAAKPAATGGVSLPWKRNAA